MKKLLWAILATAIIAGANPETCYAKKKSKKNDKKEQVKDTTAKESKYEKLIKGAKTQKGMFTLHITNDNKLLVEVPVDEPHVPVVEPCSRHDRSQNIRRRRNDDQSVHDTIQQKRTVALHAPRSAPEHHRRERSHSGIFRQKFWRPYYQSIQNLYPKRERRGSRHE